MVLNPEVNTVTVWSDLAKEKPQTLMQYFLQQAQIFSLGYSALLSNVHPGLLK